MMKLLDYVYRLSALIFVFVGLPLSLYIFGDFPKRTLLMEIISLVTILGFSLLLSQFFTSRFNRNLVKEIKKVNVLAVHKFIGYLFILIILLHPFFIIIPKFLDNGVAPLDALTRLLTTFTSTGVIMGLIAYGAMIILMITSFFRFKLNLHYRTWRKLHGYLALFFVITATWHVIDIGRHSNTVFSIFYIVILAGGIFYLLRTYLFKTSKS